MNNSVEYVVYPMWVMVCDRCGFVGTLWEKPGTGASYVEHCISCGGTSVEVEEVNDVEEWDEVKLAVSEGDVE